MTRIGRFGQLCAAAGAAAKSASKTKIHLKCPSPGWPARLKEGQPAIDHQRAAGDERALVACEPQYRPCNLLRRCPATQKRDAGTLGLERFHILARRLRSPDMELGQRRSWADSVDPHAIG